MLILFTILVVLSAVAVLAIYAKRRNSLSLEQNPPKTINAENFRPLFEPTEFEIRAFAREEEAREEAKKADEMRRTLEKKIEELSEFKEVWAQAPDREKTIELIFQSAATENAKIFSEISENVIKFWRENRIENLEAQDLADLLDSHFRILPQQERTSGAIFWLKAEIERLRREVRGK